MSSDQAKSSMFYEKPAFFFTKRCVFVVYLRILIW